MSERINFDFGWLFHRGEIEAVQPAAKGPMYNGAKTERALIGPASIGYNDDNENGGSNREIQTDVWERVNLPHDYVVTQTPEPQYNNALGYFKYENAWYRKHFRLEQSDSDKRLTLYFGAVQTKATVWVNGCLMGHSFTGYTPFEIDITDVARFGADNLVALYVEAAEHEGWWYEGAGICRHVYLVKASDVSIDTDGVYVRPFYTKKSGRWVVPTDATVRNDSPCPRTVTVRCEMSDADGNQCDYSEAINYIQPFSKSTCCSSFDFAEPKLWDTENPNLYSMKTTVFENGKAIDESITRFGFRTIEWRADGFYLNGVKTYLYGVCCHQDYGLTGKAIPDNIHRYRLRLMKEMGANALRTSHYPNAEETMDACDELGILVMDEIRWFESTPEAISQLEALLRRDRCRPSVIMWSMGNEEPFHAKPQGRRIMERLYNKVKTFNYGAGDDGRAVMTAISNDPVHAAFNDITDVIGINYNRDAFDVLREKYPDKAILSSECCATGTTRGWYRQSDFKRGYTSAFDHDNDSKTWFSGRELMRKFVLERPYIAGEFQWAGIEHRGETMWPRLCSCSGAVDMFLMKKDPFYQNKSHWTKTPMVHILPHLNLEGREGERVTAWVYTNCAEVELFCDGVSLGRRAVEAGGHYEAEFVYPAQKLTAIGFNNGVESARDEVEHTGKAKALKLEWMNSDDFAFNGRDAAVLHCTCTDENGLTVPDASPFVSFYVSGPGYIIGTGSDDTDHVPPQCPDRIMFSGMIAAAVAANGPIKVYAIADGLTTASIELK